MQKYWKYRLVYLWRNIIENAVLGDQLRDTRLFSYHDSRTNRWKLSNLSRGHVVTNPNIPGLYVIKNALNQSEISVIQSFVSNISDYCSRNDNIDDNTFSTWYEFDPGRYLIPMLPDSDFKDDLVNFEVFNNVHPSKWLKLDTLDCLGAKVLNSLQMAVPSMVDTKFQDMKCFLIQFQRMEAGVAIRPHVDADIPKCDIVATLSVNGDKNLLRVGAEEFYISVGDVYVLSGFARHHVKHEVTPSHSTRDSITLRYISTDANYRVKNPSN